MLKHILMTTALTAAIATPAFADSATPTTKANDDSAVVGAVTIDYVLSADRIIGEDVRNAQGETLGSVEDLIVTRDDRVAMAILSVGGFLGIGDKLVAVRYDELRPTKDGFIMYDVSKDQLEKAASFSYEEDATAARDRYLRSVDRQMDEWNERVDRYYDQAKDSAKDTTAEAKGDLKETWIATKQKFAEMKNATGEAWDDARASFEEAMEDLKRSWDNARS
ncbi:PRC-barrel domain-containing protein [Oceanibacterium hippocampi]|uniref:PRC-barrel domain protein n=1 Tax=Oceanibacterium hippocampi TaxID=745714 RepID=A0A1Y5TYR5_9PROT|nr:PRC-barrel domain-containing protein [Oceanibacterium hippocampi]SLN73766.1 PRC-barrel domain protein [Oceanibacterium hippocampi]